MAAAYPYNLSKAELARRLEDALKDAEQAKAEIEEVKAHNRALMEENAREDSQTFKRYLAMRQHCARLQSEVDQWRGYFTRIQETERRLEEFPRTEVVERRPEGIAQDWRDLEAKTSLHDTDYYSRREPLKQWWEL